MNRNRSISVFSMMVGVGLLLLMAWAGMATEPAHAQGGPVWPTLVAQDIGIAFNEPTFITHAGDGSGRMFVVQKGGLIRIVVGGTVLPTPYIDLDAVVGSSGSEQGLLSMAFSPNYATNGEFYVNYTNNSGNTVIARYSVSANPDVANPASAQIILTINQPYSNHNGGQLQFGDDGKLYIGMGDGGSGGDPQNHAQNTNDLLGKILRLDVETGDPITYTIPADNPYVGQSGYRGEIWHIGTRNPWRFSFDRQTDDMYIADVGQGNWEEIDFQPAASTGGENWGWRCYEGNAAYNTSGCGSSSNYDFPVAQYSHGSGCSVTGGYVYRGPNYPRMQGVYFYADYCSGNLWGLQNIGGTQGWVTQLLITASGNPITFGEDEAGNLYMGTQNGRIYQLTDPSGGATPTPTSTTVPATPTNTNTPVPPTPSNTPVPPTATATTPPSAVDVGTITASAPSVLPYGMVIGSALLAFGVVGLLWSLRKR